MAAKWGRSGTQARPWPKYPYERRPGRTFQLSEGRCSRGPFQYLGIQKLRLRRGGLFKLMLSSDVLRFG